MCNKLYERKRGGNSQMTRTMKKFTGFVLMVCMIVSLFAGVTTAFAAKDFKDVPGDNWAKPYVDFVVDKGYFAGATADLFKPDDNMTRGMFVAVIAKVEGLTLDNNVAVDFNDVQSGKYYAGAVKWATDNGIVSGYGNGSFGPNDAITREQICVMMDKYIQYHDANNDTKYLDRKASVDFKDASDISSWAKDSVQKCVSYGLVQGFPDGKFYPKRNATRAEVAVMIYRLALWKDAVDGVEYKVSYKYVSGTEGVELPAALNILIVPDSRTFHSGDVAEAYDPALSTYYADGKQWKFEGYKEKTITVKDADVEFVGVWVAEDASEMHVKYVYVDVDGKNAVPVKAPVDEKAYKKGDKVTAAAPESPVKTDNGTWTFVGWDKDGAQTKTETVEDHDVVFTGYWKYSATKFHVTYVAKVYGTGADLPKEVAKELEGRCPVDDKEYNDGDTVWIKEPTSKADYADSTGRVWNYRGASYSMLTKVKGADIEVVQYWAYAGLPYMVNYSNSSDSNVEMSPADTRNLNQALPKPAIETHYPGEIVKIKYPTKNVAKARNLLIVIPDYDVNGEWVFDHYEVIDSNKVGKAAFYPDKDTEFRMPSDAVTLIAHWVFHEYANVKYSNNINNKELNKLLPKPNPTKDYLVPGDELKVQEPSKKSVTINGETYTYTGATINGEKVEDDPYVVKESDINSATKTVDVVWNWSQKQVKVTYQFRPSGLPTNVTKLLGNEGEKYPKVQYYDEDYDGLIVPWELDENDREVRAQGRTWYWGGWDKYYVYNDGSDVVFTGTWTTEPTNYVSFSFVSTRKSDGLKDVLAENDIPETIINLNRKGEEIKLPAVNEVDGWTFKGWTTNPNASKPKYEAPGTKVNITRSTQYVGVWEKNRT